MTDVPQGIDSGVVDIGVSGLGLKPDGLGEVYGARIAEICTEFEAIRNDGFYGADENRNKPRFSQSIILHGLAGQISVGPSDGAVEVNGVRFARNESIFVPPVVEDVSRIAENGVLSSEISFLGSKDIGYVEQETSGCADFYFQDKPHPLLADFIRSVTPKISSRDYVTTLDDGPGSATIMFAFDSSRLGLASLIEKSMKDTDPADRLWPNQLTPEVQRIEFPAPGKGSHLAVPVGLPANYIEYIVVNEKSPYWQGERMDQLRQAANVDGHPIPLVSVFTGTIV